jgi:anti-anti-sigma regulatory factor
MARKKKGGMLGFDPLAWMKEGAGSAGAPASESPAPPAAAPETAVTVDLGESLTIERVGEVHARLLRTAGRRVALAAQSLRSIDTAGVQLLGAFVADAARRGTAVEWRAPHAAVYQAAQQLGLQALLRLP